MGMTHGTIAGLLLTDLIFGRDNAWAEIFKPSRKKAAAWKDYVKENLSVALQYTDYATGADVDSVHDIRPGEGAVMRHGAGLAAVRRDEAGGEQMLSAKCRHLGCIVHWNSLEKSWDCPCHGSRYDTEGANLDAPAHHPLERVEVEEPAAAGGAGAAQPRKR